MASLINDLIQLQIRLHYTTTPHTRQTLMTIFNHYPNWINRSLLILTCFYFVNISALWSQPVESPDQTIVDVFTFRPESILSGKINNALTPQLSLHCYKDFITFEENSYRAKLHNDGTYSFFNVRIDEPTVALLTYNELKLELFLENYSELKLDFDYNDFFGTLKFEGAGSEMNNYLIAALRQFHTYDWEMINYEMSQRSPMDFRRFMDDIHDKKIAFFQEYMASNEVNFSERFISFIQADIDYWWAYYLMRYRNEYPATKGLPIPMTLPAAYYNFLLDIKISNDKALMNKYYNYFLDDFFNFVQTHPIELQQLESGEIGLLVKNDTYGIADGPFGIEVIMNISAGEMLKVLDNRLNKQDINDNIWYHLETLQGQAVRISGADLSIPTVAKTTVIDKAVAKREVDAIDNQIDVFATVKLEDLQIRKEAHLEEHFATLPQGIEVDILNHSTKDSIHYKHNGESYNDFFIEIKMENGQTGWVSQSGLDIQERIIAKAVKKEIQLSIAPEIYNIATKYLTGDVLEYTLAKNVYLRSSTTKPEQLFKELDDFTSFSKNERYKKIVKNAYDYAVTGEAKKPQLLELQQLEPGANKSGGDLGNLYFEFAALKAAGKLSDEDEKNMESKLYANIPYRSDNRKAVTTTLKGTIEFPIKAELELVLYTDPIIYRQKRMAIKMDTLTNTFNQSFSIVEPTIGELHYGNRSIPLYLEPGDNLDLSFTGIRFIRTAKFKGKGGAHNNYLLESQKVFTPLDEEMRASLRFAKPDRFKKYMSLLLIDKETFYNDFKERPQFSTNFQRYAKGDISYWHAFYLLNYAWEHPLYKGKKAPMEMPTGYYDFLKEVRLDVKSLLPNQYYAYFIQQYIDYKLNLPENKGKKMNKMEAAQKYLKGEAFYYYKSSLLVTACRKGKAQIAGWVIQDFMEKNPYETYNQVLQYTYQDSKGLIKNSSAPRFELVDINGDSISLQDYAGKVVLVDFWATWCAPCIRNISFTQRLKQQFKNEDIAFLYISLDESKEKWERYVTANRLKGVHLSAEKGKGYQSEIASLYKVKKLPTYILIDKEGKVAQDPDRLLGMGELQTSISKLLYEEGDIRIGER